MKTYIVAVGLCLIAGHLAAQKIDPKDVPASAKANLEKSLHVKDAKWENEDNNYEATFRRNGKEMSAVFDQAGVLLETEEEITKSELPTAVQDALKKDFVNFKLEEVAKIAAKGVITYEAEVEKGKENFELIFEGNGKLLKKEKKKEDKD